jgi:hypothetical protein
MTWMIGTIYSVIDGDTFDVTVERSGGPYATSIRPNERVRMVNHEITALRPGWQNPYGSQSSQGLVGRKIYCEIHSRSADSMLVVTARPT